eukprot:403363961
MADNLDFQEIEDDEFHPDEYIDANQNQDQSLITKSDTDQKLHTEGVPKSSGVYQQQNQQLKKPATAFQLYIGDLKNDLSFKESLGANHKGFLQEASMRWNVLDAQTKNSFNERAQKLREQHNVLKESLASKKQQRQNQDFNEEEGDEDLLNGENNYDDDPQSMRRKFIQLPANRIRNLIQKDEDYNLISKQSLLLITKATEMFISDLAGVCDLRYTQCCQQYRQVSFHQGEQITFFETQKARRK